MNLRPLPDLSPSLFKQLGSLDEGVLKLSWHFEKKVCCVSAALEKCVDTCSRVSNLRCILTDYVPTDSQNHRYHFPSTVLTSLFGAVCSNSSKPTSTFR